MVIEGVALKVPLGIIFRIDRSLIITTKLKHFVDLGKVKSTAQPSTTFSDLSIHSVISNDLETSKKIYSLLNEEISS